MPQKRYRPEEIIAKLREAEVLLAQGKKVPDVVRALGVSEVTYLSPSNPGQQWPLTAGDLVDIASDRSGRGRAPSWRRLAGSRPTVNQRSGTRMTP